MAVVVVGTAEPNRLRVTDRHERLAGVPELECANPQRL